MNDTILFWTQVGTLGGIILGFILLYHKLYGKLHGDIRKSYEGQINLLREKITSSTGLKSKYGFMKIYLEAEKKTAIKRSKE